MDWNLDGLELGLEPVSLMIKKSRLRWFGHVEQNVACAYICIYIYVYIYLFIYLFI